MAKYCSLFFGISALCISTFAQATPPSESLLPSTTKGYLSVPDVQLLGERWDETQLGQLAKDPIMKPFADDLRAQIQGKLSGTRLRLGLSMEDLKGIYGGELSIAVVQPQNDATQHATALIVDVTGHLDQVQETLAKVRGNLLDQGAKERASKLDGVDVTVFTLPKKREDSPTVEPHYALHQDTLIVTDHAALCEQILQRLNGKQVGEVLADHFVFNATFERCARDSGDVAPHIRWFVEPFGYGMAARVAAGGRQRKGPDLLRILPAQGFDAIRGIGGYVYFATGAEEIVHRTMVYAPPVDGEQGYRLAARMLEFPNNDVHDPQDFVPRDLGSYFTFNWKMKEAFEHSKTLVNALLGGDKDGDLMEDIIDGLAMDKDGPQVDLRKDLVAHFAERASMITDCRRPITPESERLLVAVELTNPEAVRATIDKAFDTDPDAEKREFEGHVIWEIIKESAPADVEELQIEGDGFGAFDPFAEQQVPDLPAQNNNQENILPNSAITVAHGHLIVATHVDSIVEMLQRPLGTELLRDAADYQLINSALAKIGAGSSSFRFFARTDETYRPTYELIRQGKMPESKTVLGRVLNQLLGPDEKGILREQEIDGTKMPEFDAVRRYLGPSGMYVHSEPDGWFMAGCLISKELQ